MAAAPGSVVPDRKNVMNWSALEVGAFIRSKSTVFGVYASALETLGITGEQFVTDIDDDWITENITSKVHRSTFKRLITELKAAASGVVPAPPVPAATIGAAATVTAATAGPVASAAPPSKGRLNVGQWGNGNVSIVGGSYNPEIAKLVVDGGKETQRIAATYKVPEQGKALLDAVERGVDVNVKQVGFGNWLYEIEPMRTTEVEDGLIFHFTPPKTPDAVAWRLIRRQRGANQKNVDSRATNANTVHVPKESKYDLVAEGIDEYGEVCAEIDYKDAVKGGTGSYRQIARTASSSSASSKPIIKMRGAFMYVDKHYRDQNCPVWPYLLGTSGDAKWWYSRLTTSGHVTEDESLIRTRATASHEKIENEVTAYLGGGEAVFVVFSGHGYVDRGAGLQIITSDSKPLSRDEFITKVMKGQGKNKPRFGIFVFDCCSNPLPEGAHSYAIGDTWAKQPEAMNYPVCIITASCPYGMAQDGSKTGLLVEAYEKALTQAGSRSLAAVHRRATLICQQMKMDRTFEMRMIGASEQFDPNDFYPFDSPTKTTAAAAAAAKK